MNEKNKKYNNNQWIKFASQLAFNRPLSLTLAWNAPYSFPLLNNPSWAQPIQQL